MENATLFQVLPTYQVVIDHSRTLAEMISAGRYDWVNSDVSAEHFPVRGEGKVALEIALLNFNRYIEGDEAIEEMDKAVYEPADLPGLLALGESQPDLQRQFSIVALASVWRLPRGRRAVPCLWSGDGERRLGLCWLGGALNPRYRFAARRKSG